MAVAVAGGAVLASTGTAAAAPLQCDASALRGTILGQGAVEPVTANRGASACTNAAAGGATAAQALSALPLNASILEAATKVTPAGTPNEKQAAQAQGGVANLTVKALPTLPITLPTATIPTALQTLTVPVSSLTSAIPLLGPTLALIPGVPASLTFDLKPAIDALLPAGQLPNVELVNVGAAVAYAGAACKDGKSVPFGFTQVADVKVLGQTLPTDTAADQTLSLDTGNITLSTLDVTKITLPPGLSGPLASALTPLLGTIQTAVLQPLIAALPPVSLPGALARVKVTPSSQTLGAGGTSLVQRGPRIEVSIAGQSVVDVILGEATVGTAGVDCTPAPASASDLALSCTKRRLVLIDVLTQGSRVELLGAADRKLAGQTVSLRLASTGKVVATAKVRTDGSFSAFAPLPPKAIRTTNAARYQATLGREKSLNLKLARRMVVSLLTARSGKVTIAGRVILPLAKPVSSITLTRVISCKKLEVVKRFKPKRDGTFSVTVAAPKGQAAAVYRLSTRVRRTARSATTSPTFTLPRGVNLTR